MKKIVITFVLLLISNFCFPQQNLKISGRIPPPDSEKIYRIQLGSFKISRNAERVFVRLRNAGFNPVYENYRDFTRVLLTNINAGNISLLLKNIELMGFREVWITEDRNAVPPAGFLVDPNEYIQGGTAGPSGGTWERPGYYMPENPGAAPVERRGPEQYPQDQVRAPSPNFIMDPTYYTVQIGESKTIDLKTGAANLGVEWSSHNPRIAMVDTTGKVTGISTGSTVIEASHGGTLTGISVTVVPAVNIYYVPKDQETFVEMNENTLVTPGTVGLTEYRTEPTARLAYRFVNPGDSRGASGINGGIDVLGKGKDDRWMWTTYYQGGFFYDLNGVQHVMTNGVQRDRNGVELTVEPSFVYIDGVSYLQLTHTLKNTSRVVVSGQKFGAGADIMIHNNDHAPVVANDYGLVMTDASDENISNLNLMFIGKIGEVPVSTLWIGRWGRGEYLEHIYTDGVDSQFYEGADSAMAFSFQNITLLPNESQTYSVRFTLARNSN